MVNDPKEILDILNSFDNMTKEQLDKAIKNTDKEYTAAEIADLQKQSYYQGRADEEEKWETLKEDLTTIYMSGFYDGEKKWRDKIKKEIEEYKKYDNGKNYENEISVLENVLKEKKDET